MKKILFYLSALCLLGGCTGREDIADISTPADTGRILIVQVVDFSKSIHGITYFDSAAVKHLYTTLANHNGGTVKLIGAYISSVKGNAAIHAMDVSRLDTLPLA